MADFPSPTSAYGVWDMLDVRDAVMGANWPVPVQPTTTLVGNGVTFSGGTATASSSIDVGRQPSAAFDGYTNDEVQCWHSASFAGNQWIQFDFGSGVTKVVTAYWIMARPSDDWYPSTWTFLGSNDGSTFTTLDTKASQTIPAPSAGVTSTQPQNFNKYTISNTTQYRYYRLNVTATTGGNSYCVIGEMALLGY